MDHAGRQVLIETIRKENEEGFGPPARRAVQKLLANGLPHPWMYVYELTQNARDAGARRVLWRTDGNSVLFQHDGDVALDEAHVRGISSLGASTKGLTAVGFMGVGFKSVFARFRSARVSGFGWRFGFTVKTEKGDIDSSVPVWFDTLRPFWDDEAPAPEEGYTTAFFLQQPADLERSIQADLDRLASPEDPCGMTYLGEQQLNQHTLRTVSYTDRNEDPRILCGSI